MKIEARRHLYAWLLLSVFVPMMAIASLHIHPNYNEEASTICLSCIHHQAHAGHLIKATGHLHDCVLCQFLTLTYVSAAVVAVAFIFHAVWILHAPHQRFVCCSSWCNIVTRGPPAA